ncbi:MAG: hypothetical protein ACPGID_14265, partial [Rubricella sp.]
MAGEGKPFGVPAGQSRFLPGRFTASTAVGGIMVQRITLLHHAANIRPVERALPFFRNAGLEARGMAYEAAFARLSVPRGAVIFTDFEFLNAIEQDAAGLIARAVSSSTRTATVTVRSRAFLSAGVNRTPSWPARSAMRMARS